MNSLFITCAFCVAPLTVSLLLLDASAQNATYSTAGIYTNVAPAGVGRVTFKLWGGGGAGMVNPTNPIPFIGVGGGGAFSSVTLDVQVGDTFVVVVGQRGAASGGSLGGAGSGNTAGGTAGGFGVPYGAGQGGQASSVFLVTNNLLVTKAVAGAGGGAGIGINRNGGAAGQPGLFTPPSSFGGQPGANGVGGFSGGFSATDGGNYNANAITNGISALNQAGGNGGNGGNSSGGGGGGYGGGGGGGNVNLGSGGGGGGGGSYGTTIINGNGFTPGSTSDAHYLGSAAQGGPGGAGFDGLAVVLWIPTNLPEPGLSNSKRLGDGSFQFSFTNITGAPFTTLATTNIVNGSNSWTVLGPATEIAPGQFQFTDPQAINHPQRFYQVRSP